MYGYRVAAMMPRPEMTGHTKTPPAAEEADEDA
jgi:hypothetical protein